MRKHSTIERDFRDLKIVFSMFIISILAGLILFGIGATLYGVFGFVITAIYGFGSIVLVILIQGKRTREFLSDIHNVPYYPKYCKCDYCVEKVNEKNDLKDRVEELEDDIKSLKKDKK